MSMSYGRLDRRGVVWGAVAVAIVLALSFIGSDRLVWFDAALVGYLFGVVFAVFGVAYRYAVWLRRPSTAMLNRRGWDAFRQRKFRNSAALPSLVATQLLAQGFIRRRSRARWLAHQLVFWGCILAGLVTLPLTLGLLHFESVGQRADRYQVYVSRIGTLHFDAESIVGWLIFHALDIAAVLVLAGVFIFLRRRLRDPGALATERSGDFLALAGLFAVSVTGLFVTVSSVWLEGRFYAALNTIHALTVILGLMYLPFGKLFHILLGRDPSDLLAFACIAAFVLGLVLYVIVMTMVFMRWTFQPLDPTEADPPAWIAAGAVAITLLAGSNLLGVRDASARIERLAPFIEGLVVLAWATATFWFPLMIAIGIWRHIVRRVPLRYHPSYWSLVFPLGMYGAATFRMESVTGLDQLDVLPQFTLAAALAAWTTTMLGLMWQGAEVARTRRGRAHGSG